MAQRVVGAKDGGTCCSIDVKRCEPGILSFVDHVGELGWVHAPRFVGWNGKNGGTAEPKHLGSFLNAIMAMSAGEEDKSSPGGVVSALFGVGE